MARPSKSPLKVALLWRGDAQSRLDARPETSRFNAIFASLRRAGIEAEPAVYFEDLASGVYNQLVHVDAVLVWVNPNDAGLRRETLDDLLRKVAATGTFVSAHPDIIAKMGVKAVLYRTKTLGWGTETYYYETPEQFETEFSRRLALNGPRVLKHNRGNGGAGVWKITTGDEAKINVLSAQSDEPPRTMLLADFITERRADFAASEGLVDQPFQSRHLDGMVRCYMSGDRVVGFGHQLVRALADREEGPAGPRLYSGPDDKRFQGLRRAMENDWTPGMARLLQIETDDLPIIWDADFLFGPKVPDGQDTYVLCEINVSSVFPIPDEAPDALVGTLLRHFKE